MSITTNPKRGGMSKPRTGKARDRQSIISDTIKRITPGNPGPAGAPGAPGGVTSYNGRVGVVVPNLGDATLDINAHVALADPHVQYQKESEKSIAGGYASLDGTGRVPTGELPAIAITDTFVVGSQAAMLALVAETGDVAVRTDLNQSFILTALPATILANWQALLAPLDAVSSVAGKTGVVLLVEADIANLVADLAARALLTDSRFIDKRLPVQLIGSYDQNTASVPMLTDQFMIQYKRLALSGGERLVVPGTANVLLTDFGNRTTSPNVGTPKLPASFCVPTDYFLYQAQRLTMEKQNRATLQGNADLIISDDFSSRSRVVLAGRG